MDAALDLTLRRQLPPFGRGLLQARRQGRHPHEVWVVYGEDWRGAQRPFLAVRPRQFVPGRFDWRMVAGVKVVLIDRAAAVAGCNVETGEFGDFFELAGELVDARAYVEVRHVRDRAWVDEDLGMLAWACRRAEGGRMNWPCWWSDARAALQSAACDGWLADLGRSVSVQSSGAALESSQ